LASVHGKGQAANKSVSSRPLKVRMVRFIAKQPKCATAMKKGHYFFGPNLYSPASEAGAKSERKSLIAVATANNAFVPAVFGRLNNAHLVHGAIGRHGIVRAFTVILWFAARPMSHVHMHGQGEGNFCVTNWALHDTHYLFRGAGQSRARKHVEKRNSEPARRQNEEPGTGTGTPHQEI
jgi:hypothetical protein